jgi:hypothetical protein
MGRSRSRLKKSSMKLNHKLESVHFCCLQFKVIIHRFFFIFYESNVFLIIYHTREYYVLIRLIKQKTPDSKLSTSSFVKLTIPNFFS